ncbi:serine/threonine protein kinase [Pantanalinema rosaneae CENA516]|uniref:serine/threonine protein kinase n=1 Tax=Pantanalinema rosaneae TaxID=1620701 RepID=UPI003D6F57D5
MEARILNDRYKLQRRLSKKGARQTLLAQDLTTGDAVVIKLLMFDAAFQWEDHKLFERGAGTLKSLSHPSLPKYLDYFDVTLQKAQGFAQVQSYIPAKSLEEHLKDGRSFSESDIQQIARELLSILIYLHSRQPAIIHRDIKPSNILLGDRSGNCVGNVYLVDFDSVQVHTEAKVGSTMTVVGTYGYMPPEQFGGQASPASDLYSLGATLIYIATGKHPADLPQENFQIQFEPFVNLNPQLIDWLKWLTDPDLKKRPHSAEQALQAFNQPDLPIPGRKMGDAIAKPKDSKVVLRSHPTALEIIATYSLSDSLSFMPLVATVGCLIGAIPLLIGVLTLLTGLFTLFFGLLSLNLESIISGIVIICLFSLIPLFIGGMFMVPLLLCLPRQRRLYINASKLSLTRKFLFLGSTMTADRKEIKQLACQTLPQQVILVAHQQKFIIPTSSVRELEWLGQELSQWLKLPVTKL